MIFVMKTKQESSISEVYRHLDPPPTEVLHIEDEFDFLDPELASKLIDGINSTLKATYKTYKKVDSQLIEIPLNSSERSIREHHAHEQVFIEAV